MPAGPGERQEAEEQEEGLGRCRPVPPSIPGTPASPGSPYPPLPCGWPDRSTDQLVGIGIVSRQTRPGGRREGRAGAPPPTPRASRTQESGTPRAKHSGGPALLSGLPLSTQGDSDHLRPDGRRARSPNTNTRSRRTTGECRPLGTGYRVVLACSESPSPPHPCRFGGHAPPPPPPWLPG